MNRTALTRRAPVKQANPKRKAKAYARNFGDRGEQVRAMPCLVSAYFKRSWELAPGDKPCQGDVQAAHAIARGMGGAKGDRRTLVPLCHGHHAEAGERGTSQRAAFEERYGLDLQAEAERIAIELDGRGLA